MTEGILSTHEMFSVWDPGANKFHEIHQVITAHHSSKRAED